MFSDFMVPDAEKSTKCHSYPMGEFLVCFFPVGSTYLINSGTSRKIDFVMNPQSTALRNGLAFLIMAGKTNEILHTLEIILVGGKHRK